MNPQFETLNMYLLNNSDKFSSKYSFNDILISSRYNIELTEQDLDHDIHHFAHSEVLNNKSINMLFN